MIGIAPIACAHSAIIRRLFNELSRIHTCAFIRFTPLVSVINSAIIWRLFNELSRIHTCAFIRFTPLVSVIHSAINSAIIRCVEMHSHLRLHQVHTARLGFIRREDVKRRIRICPSDTRLIHPTMVHNTTLRQQLLHMIAPRAVPPLTPMVRLKPAREPAVHVQLRLGDFGP